MVRNHKMVDNLIFDIPITAIHGGTDDKVTSLLLLNGYVTTGALMAG